MNFTHTFLMRLLLSFLSFSCKTTHPISTDKKPNIVFIVADDLGYSDVEYMNQKAGIKTPNINKLMNSGMMFTDAYAAAPVCSPTRAIIMTGKSPAAVKITCHIPGIGMEQYMERQNK